MLQSIFKRTVCKNLPKLLRAKCSTRSSTTLKKVGTVHVDRYEADHRGHKFMLVKTKSANSHRDQVHHLYTAVRWDFKEGQRVYVGGNLSSKKCITLENKTVSRPIIQAYSIYALNSKNSAAAFDVNSVKLLTTVCADVVNKHNHSIIHVVTNYMNESTQEIQSNFHAIFVHDPHLCKIVRETVEKSDRIFVTGFLSGNTNTNANGKRFQSGFIVAEHIDRIERFSRNRFYKIRPTSEREFNK